MWGLTSKVDDHRHVRCVGMSSGNMSKINARKSEHEEEEEEEEEEGG